MSCGIPFEGATVLIDGAQAVAQVDPQKAFRMLLDAAMCANYAGDPNLLMQAAKMAGELPIRETEPEAPVVELLGGLASMLEGKDAELHARLVQSLDRVDSVTEPLWLIFACVVAESIGDEAREEVFRRRAEAIARTSMAVGTLATVLERIAATDMNHGQVAAASLHSGEGLQFALDAGLTNSACFHRVVLAWAAAVRGDQEACISLAEEVAVTALKHGLPLNKLVADWAVGLLQLGLGRWEEAVTRLEGMSAAGPGADPPLIALRFVADLVEAAVRADRSDIAEWAATWLAEHAGEGAPDWQLALAARCRALVDPSIEAREGCYRRHWSFTPTTGGRSTEPGRCSCSVSCYVASDVARRRAYRFAPPSMPSSSSAPRPGRSGPGVSFGPPAKPFGAATLPRLKSSPCRNDKSRQSWQKGPRTGRRLPCCSSAHAPSSTT